MAANRFLAGSRGLSEETIKRIDILHDFLEHIIEEAILKNSSGESTLKVIAYWEEYLQSLWGFPVDPSKHTWNRRYLFKKQWAFTNWECEQTGEKFTIPFGVEETDYFVVGKGFVDVGRYGSYHRVSGVKQLGVE